MESSVGASDGTATVIATGGTGNLTISWNTTPVQDTAVAIGLATGDYVFIVTDANGCTISDTVNVGLNIGIQDIESNLSVKVYPNPAVNMINFEITGVDRVTLYVFDFTGRQVKEMVINEVLTEINTNDLNNGMYFYQLISTKSEKLSSGKFVIQK